MGQSDPIRDTITTDLAVRAPLQLVYAHDDGVLDLAWEMAITAYLEAKRALSGSSRTPDLYRCAIRAFQGWLALPLREASSFHAQHYVAWMYSDRVAGTLTGYLDALDGDVVPGEAHGLQSACGLQAGRGPLSPATVNLHLSALRGLFDFIRDRYTVTRSDGTVATLWPADRANPFASVARAKVKPFGRASYPSGEELAAILAQINTDCLTGKRDFALLYALATTCRRASAILGLRWGDILERNDAGDYIFQFHYKGDQRGELRRAVLNKVAYQAIAAYLEADGRPPAEMAPTDHVFIPLYPERISRLPTVDAAQVDPNAPISNSYANRILKKYARRVRLGPERRPMDVSRAHIHGLRHAGARLRVQQMRDRRGYVDFEEIQRLLGHAGLAVTQVYIQEVCTDPTDAGGADAAAALLPKARRRRGAPTCAPEQERLL